MNIVLNGEARAVRAETLAALLAECEFPADSVATAVNREFVPRGERAETPIRDGDAVEVLSPMKGG